MGPGTWCFLEKADPPAGTEITLLDPFAKTLGDTVDGLRGILRESFRDVNVEVVGSAALFAASRPIPASP